MNSLRQSSVAYERKHLYFTVTKENKKMAKKILITSLNPIMQTSESFDHILNLLFGSLLLINLLAE